MSIESDKVWLCASMCIGDVPAQHIEVKLGVWATFSNKNVACIAFIYIMALTGRVILQAGGPANLIAVCELADMQRC